MEDPRHRLVCITCNPFPLFLIPFEPQDIIIRILSRLKPDMLRSKFHIFRMDNSKIN